MDVSMTADVKWRHSADLSYRTEAPAGFEPATSVPFPLTKVNTRSYAGNFLLHHTLPLAWPYTCSTGVLCLEGTLRDYSIV